MRAVKKKDPYGRRHARITERKKKIRQKQYDAPVTKAGEKKVARLEKRYDRLAGRARRIREKWHMKLVSTLCVSFALLLAANFVTPVEDNDICNSGICVVEFNASFNSANTVPWIEDLDDCYTNRVDIAASPDLQKKHKIVVVPTIVVFNEGEEVTRFQANIMMTMDASQSDVQDAIDDVMLNDF